MDALSYKAAPAEFKTDSQHEGAYEGYFAITGNTDYGADVIEPGAFTKTLQERPGKIRVLWGHDPTKPIGPSPEILSEDSQGLYAKGRLSVKSAAGREAWELLVDGAVSEGSVGYIPLAARTQWKAGVRHIGELKLLEISFVGLGMNPDTRLRALKALYDGAHEPTLADYLDALEGCTAELKSGRMLSQGNIDTLTGAQARMQNACGAMQEAMDAMQALIDAATPQDEKALHLAPPEAALRLRLRAAQLGLTLAH